MTAPYDGPMDNVILAAQQYLDDTGGPDRICHYCFHPRSSEFCQTSHPYDREPWP